MKLPTPRECGLPERFDSWRPVQESALDFALNCPSRTKALCMPTGSGKTATYVAYALLSQKPTCFVTDSRGLQDQLLEQFGSIGMVDIRGRKNYQCGMPGKDYTCEDGYAARCPMKGTIKCPSSQAEMAAATSPLVVTNYDKWTSSKKYGLGMQHFQQVVFDEGHEAPNALAKAVQVILYAREINDDLGLDFPSGTNREDMEEWKLWAQASRLVAETKMLAARAKAQQPDPKPAWVKAFTHLRRLCKRLATLSTCRPLDWVVEEHDRHFQFDPIRPGRYSEMAMLLKIPSIVIVSATIRPKTLYMLGIGKADSQFMEFDSDFDPRDCPIYYIPTMRMDWKADDYSPLWLRLDQIAAKRRDRKGIVQTVSFGRRDMVVEASRFRQSMLVNPQGEAPTEVIETFRNSGPGTILVSPSVGTGYDFPGRDCEWQFLCKIPFPPPSNILKARTADDSELPYYLAMTKMVQIFGRGRRYKGDRCENMIGDGHMDWFYPRYSYLAPRSFNSFYRQVSVLPQPPEKL